MGRAERVVFALGTLGEARQAAALAKGANAVAAPGENLMRIGLMADVPDQPVGGRVEQIMQRDSELDHAEPRAEMAAGHRDGADRFLPELVGELGELILGEKLEVRRSVDQVEQRGCALCRVSRVDRPHVASPSSSRGELQRLIRFVCGLPPLEPLEQSEHPQRLPTEIPPSQAVGEVCARRRRSNAFDQESRLLQARRRRVTLDRLPA